jgi:hypothetical protein
MAYSKIIHVHHGGRVTSLSSGVEFVDMTSQVVFFPHSPSFNEVVAKLREVLGWTNIGDDVLLEGRYDAGCGLRSFTQMIPICGVNEWDLYKELVEGSQIISLVVVAVKVIGVVRPQLLIDLNECPSVIERCNDGGCADVYEVGPSQPSNVDNEDTPPHNPCVAMLALTDTHAIIEEKVKVANIGSGETNIFRKDATPPRNHCGGVSAFTEKEDSEDSEERQGSLEGSDGEFVDVPEIMFPSSPCVPLVASSQLDGDPEIFEEKILKMRDILKLLRMTLTRTVRSSNLPRRRSMHLLRYGADIRAFMSSEMLGMHT